MKKILLIEDDTTMRENTAEILELANYKVTTATNGKEGSALAKEVKPDLIIETGVAHGGSIVYYASLLELIGGDGLVLGIDIDIRKHNRDLIEAHPMMKRIQMIEGSSVSNEVVDQVKEIAKSKKRIMVCLDSNHTHEHVLDELKLYAPLVTKDSYCVVFDSVVEDMPADYNWGVRTWGKGNNPKTALFEYLKSD